MATNELRADSVPHNLPFASSAPAAVMRVMSHYGRKRLAVFVAVAIDLMDLMDGDPCFEVGGDDEPRSADGDTKDLAYAEWTSLHGRQRVGSCIASQHEDDEEDDVGEDSHDQEAIDEREGFTDEDQNIVPPIWPGEGSA